MKLGTQFVEKYSTSNIDNCILTFSFWFDVFDLTEVS